MLCAVCEECRARATSEENNSIAVHFQRKVTLLLFLTVVWMPRNCDFEKTNTLVRKETGKKLYERYLIVYETDSVEKVPD